MKYYKRYEKERIDHTEAYRQWADRTIERLESRSDGWISVEDVKDLKWRINNIRDMLTSGPNPYCDEWAVPVKNLETLSKRIEKILPTPPKEG